jgi:3',5'-cyclic AMP phosphodiesterase CpdA
MKRIGLAVMVLILVLGLGAVSCNKTPTVPVYMGGAADFIIGPEDGEPCYSFAIIADPHVVALPTKLGDAVTEITTDYPDVEFVVVLGDIIQGEVATPGEYEAEFIAAKKELDKLGDIPYIPVIGNHDEWCNLTNGVIKFPNSSYQIQPYDTGTDGRYPEQIFEETFDDVYKGLATKLSNWDKQEGMPLSNPYGYPPPTYLQNFAFDCGPYHFIFLDCCSRQDFADISYDIPPFNNFPIFGYADLNDFSDGTLEWLKAHLDSLTPPQKQNIVLFTHHPPVYKMAIPYLTLDGDNTFAFTKSEYDQLTGLFSTNSCNIVHWFSGHYHLKGSGWAGSTDIVHWHDSVIDSDVSMIPSTMVCSEFGGQSIPPGTSVTINGAYSGNIEPNTDGGRVVIVQVNVPKPANSCYLDFNTGENTCQPPCAVVQPYEPNGGIDWALKRAVMEINMENQQSIEMKIEISEPGGNWLLNIGNSPSNNGAGGDGGDFSNDSELNIAFDESWELEVYGNDYSIDAGIPRPLLNLVDFLGRGADTIRIKIGDGRLWVRTELNGQKLNEVTLFDNDYIFRLGASDAECNCLDYQYYAAFNRVIYDSRRTGSGVDRVTFLWSDAWTWTWEIE